MSTRRWTSQESKNQAREPQVRHPHVLLIGTPSWKTSWGMTTARTLRSTARVLRSDGAFFLTTLPCTSSPHSALSRKYRGRKHAPHTQPPTRRRPPRLHLPQRRAPRDVTVLETASRYENLPIFVGQRNYGKALATTMSEICRQFRCFDSTTPRTLWGHNRWCSAEFETRNSRRGSTVGRWFTTRDGNRNGRGGKIDEDVGVGVSIAIKRNRAHRIGIFRRRCRAECFDHNVFDSV